MKMIGWCELWRKLCRVMVSMLVCGWSMCLVCEWLFLMKYLVEKLWENRVCRYLLNIVV